VDKEASNLWLDITEDPSHSWELTGFRKPGGINSRFAAWAPRELSWRWYRTFMNLAFATASPWVKSQLAQLSPTTHLGNPIVNIATWDGHELHFNLDDLMSFEELEFLLSATNHEITTVVEVGAGFGRLCHAINITIPTIERYVIVDLPKVIELSSQYLKHVLEYQEFSRIEFISTETLSNTERDLSCDLAIQVDGLQEMNESAIAAYMEIFSKSTRFYSRNVVAKYSPEAAGLSVKDEVAPLTLGRSQSKVDIWNTTELIHIYEQHIDHYTPPGHSCRLTQIDRLFPHYLNMLTIQQGIDVECK